MLLFLLFLVICVLCDTESYFITSVNFTSVESVYKPVLNRKIENTKLFGSNIHVKSKSWRGPSASSARLGLS